MATNSKFIVVQHTADRAGLHWDLRFQKPNSKNYDSFACRKEIPTDTGSKILAIRTHEHSPTEALFLGKIESGYGAGTLKKWDSGECKIYKYTSAHIVIEFSGKRLNGLYHMISIGVVGNRKLIYSKGSFMLFKSSNKEYSK